MVARKEEAALAIPLAASRAGPACSTHVPRKSARAAGVQRITRPWAAAVLFAWYPAFLCNAAPTPVDTLGLSDIEEPFSLNDLGQLTFVAKNAEGLEQVFVSTIGNSGPPQGISFVASGRTYKGAAINNAVPIAQVASSDKFGDTLLIRAWQADGAGRRTIARFDAEPNQCIDAASHWLDINDSGFTVFARKDCDSLNTYLHYGDGTLSADIANYPLFFDLSPRVSNTGDIVVREPAVPRILLYTPPSTIPAAIASSAEFDDIGHLIDITSDSTVVTFLGRRKGLTGLFASIAYPGGRHITPLLIEGQDGFFNFDMDSRPSVATLGSIENIQRIQVAFVAERNGVRGAYAATVWAILEPDDPTKSIRLIQSQADTLVQVGDPVGQKVVADMSLDESLNSAGAVAIRLVYSDGHAGLAVATMAAIPLEGGVRYALRLPTDLVELGAKIRVGDVNVENLNLYRITGSADSLVYFDPPARPEGSHAISVFGGVGPSVVVGYLTYTRDVADGIAGIRAGLETFYQEASLTPGAFAERAGIGASRAEALLASLLQRALQDDASDARVRAELGGLMPTLARFVNGLFADSPQEAFILTPAFGQTGHSPIDRARSQVLLTLASGTLMLSQDGGRPEHDASLEGDETFVFPADLKAAVDKTTLHGWTFSLDFDESTGFAVSALMASSVCSPGAQGDMQMVAARLKMPNVTLVLGPLSQRRIETRLLEKRYFSHAYINTNVLTEFSHSAGPIGEWLLSAVFRVPLEGDDPPGPNAPALIVRQTFAFTDAYADVEISGCLCGRAAFPRISFSLNQTSESNEALPVNSVRPNFRFDFAPQRGLGAEQYVAGLFRDVDTPVWNHPTEGTFGFCFPYPAWHNMFECHDATGLSIPAPVIGDIVFDTNENDPTFVTPDNIHLHQVHADTTFASSSIVEAPFSANGTVHMHWRWGASFGSEFGNGNVLLPPNQHWTMALTTHCFPDDESDFVEGIIQGPTDGNGWCMGQQPSATDPKTLMVGCEQRADEHIVDEPYLRLNRQFETMSTGFAFAIGTDPTGIPGIICPPIDRVLRWLGYWLISQSQCGVPFRKPSAEDQLLSRVDRFATAHEMMLLTLQTGRIPIAGSPMGLLGSVFLDLSGALPTRDCGGGVIREQRTVGPSKCRNVYFLDTDLGASTPLDIPYTESGVASVGIEGVSTEAIVVMGVLSSIPGPMLLLEQKSPASILVRFGNAVREVRLLGVGVACVKQVDIEVEALVGDVVQFTKHVRAIRELGPLAEAWVTVSSPTEFDGVRIRAPESSCGLALTSFSVCSDVIASGDLNLNGVHELEDFGLFSECWWGPRVPAGFICADADLNRDGVVDLLDFSQFQRLSLQLQP